MKKIILISMIISAFFLLNSCGSNKEDAEEKTDVEQTTTETNQEEVEEVDISEGQTVSQNCDEFLVEYEKFMQEYIVILKKYQENPSNPEFLAEYMEIAKESEDWDNKSADCENDPAFMTKFLEIQLKISEAAAGL
jgi:protein involved in sex pheromone biosynthesis